jgi:hypothetical protein
MSKSILNNSVFTLNTGQEKRAARRGSAAMKLPRISQMAHGEVFKLA